jgi:NAD(P)-dependent dehydrogenase (short-subunit alcohol dehydrogenase family)
MFDFQGKVLVLTGANGGIGRSLAKIFYDLGARLMLSDLEGRPLPPSNFSTKEGLRLGVMGAIVMH